MTLAAFGFSIRIFGLRKKIVVFTAGALDIVGVGADDLALLTLRELTHVDPDLLFISLTEITFM